MTLQIQSDHVYTQLGVAISVTGIAQVCICCGAYIWCHFIPVYYCVTLFWGGICCHHVSVCLSIHPSFHHKPALYQNG